MSIFKIINENSEDRIREEIKDLKRQLDDAEREVDRKYPTKNSFEYQNSSEYKKYREIKKKIEKLEDQLDDF